jgi:hypothetical protein
VSDTSASAQVLTFLVAGVLFLAAVAAVLLTTRNAGKEDRGAGEADQQQKAGRLLDLLVNSQGIGWASGADGVGRLGVRATNGSGLQQSSIDALRGALFTHATNGKVDYADARASLALSGTQDFHLRIHPVAMDAVYNAADSAQRTAYIGHWESLASLTIALGTSSGMQASAQAAINATMFSQTATERLALRHLGLDYNDRVFISVSAPTIWVDQPLLLPDVPLLTALSPLTLIDGDVYPDVKGYIDANLAGRLAGYDLLVVGSGVDQNSLTANAVKSAIRDWVLAGGTLVVLGSDKSNTQWMQPLFDSGIKTANGAASAPDPSHPLLQEPHILDWPSYNDHGQGWDIKTDGFSDVIVKDGEDVIAISDDGSLGSGRVILTTYLPREIATTLGQQEAENFLENIVLFTDHSNLYLEYGPTQPTGIPVAVAVRQSWLYDPTLGQVPIRIEVHLWGEPAP